MVIVHITAANNRTLATFVAGLRQQRVERDRPEPVSEPCRLGPVIGEKSRNASWLRFQEGVQSRNVTGAPPARGLDLHRNDVLARLDNEINLVPSLNTPEVKTGARDTGFNNGQKVLCDIGLVEMPAEEVL